MKFFRRLVMIVAALVALVALAAPTSAQGPLDPSEIDISWIGKTLNNPWWISVADFAVAEAEIWR